MPRISPGAFSGVARLAETRPGLVARLRLFGLLVLLVPVFAGLQTLLEESVPRVEIRIVPRDVPVEVPVQVPVEVPVERVVERVIYVPVPADATSLPAPESGLPVTGASPVPTPTERSAPPDVGDPSAPGANEAGASSLAPAGATAPAPPVRLAPEPGVIAPGSGVVLAPDPAGLDPFGDASAPAAGQSAAGTPVPALSAGAAPAEPADASNLTSPTDQASIGAGTTANLALATTNRAGQAQQRTSGPSGPMTIGLGSSLLSASALRAQTGSESAPTATPVPSDSTYLEQPTGPAMQRAALTEGAAAP